MDRLIGFVLTELMVLAVYAGSLGYVGYSWVLYAIDTVLDVMRRLQPCSA